RVCAQEGAVIGGAGQPPVRIVVLLDAAGRGVGDGDGVLDVRQGAVEDPELAVDRPAVAHMHHKLNVLGVEEPEVAGVTGERHRSTGAAAARDGPMRLDGEPTAL